VGSRVHGAASACLVASGLFLCGLGGALAVAQPPASPETSDASHANETPGKGPKHDSDGTGGSSGSTDKEPETGTPDTDKPGNGENPNNGNCGNGNDGSNGNAHGCGGGSSPPSSPPTEPSPSTRTTTTQTTTRTTSTTTETTTSTSTTEPGLPAPGGGGGGGGAVEVPSGRPDVPEMQLPPASEPAVIDSVPGVGAAAVDLPIPPITLPVIVAPAAGVGGGAAGAPALPAAPRGVSAEPPAGREPLPANVGSNIAVPASSYRIGYTDYLRSAGLSQVAALAVPGVAGMLVLTCAGGLVGYRQAKAGHAVHTSGTARFVN
jgi:hypothetical protein